MFNMLQLQGFVAILEAGSFAQAAKRLRITQPPLTRHIRNLERELGYDLLVRTSKGVELTQRGARFAPDAKFIVETSQRIYDKSVGEAAAAKPQLRISFVATPPPRLLAHVIEVTKGAERDGEISLIQMPSADQISSLLAGTVDLGFIRGRYRGSGLRSRVVHTERLSVAVPRSYADRLPEQIDDVETLRALEGLTPINYNSGSSEYMYNSVAAFAREPYATNATTVATVGVVLELVADGLGFGFVPETMKESARARGISFHSVNDALFPNLEVSAVWREGSLFTEWVETTVDRVISSWNNGDIGKRGSSE